MKHEPAPEGPNTMPKNLVFQSSDGEVAAEIDQDGWLVITTKPFIGYGDSLCIESKDLPNFIRLFETEDPGEEPLTEDEDPEGMKPLVELKEAGKYYEDAEGRVRGPVRYTGKDDCPFMVSDDYGRIEFDDLGSTWLNYPDRDCYRLIREVPAPNAALPVIPHGFMRWHGGKRPFRKGVLVDFILRDGDRVKCWRAEWCGWNHNLAAPKNDIIACKISEAE